MRKRLWIAVCVLAMLPSFCFGKEIDEVLKDFETYAEKARQDWQAVGMSIAVVKDGKLIYTKGFGQRSLQDKEPVTPDTVFQVGSISKAFTSALTAIAADRKLLSWEDQVVSHLPNFMLADPWVTRQFEVEDLYAQRSGLPAYVGDPQAMLDVPIETIINNLRFFQPLTSFRSQFAYQNVFFSVGAELLKSKTGLSWNELLAQEIFKPLEMTHSSSTLQAYLKEPNRVGWHVRKPGAKILPIPDDFDAADWIYVYGPAGGVNSSAKEMANWLILQADQGQFKDKQVISKENITRTTRPHIYIGERCGTSNFYCLGWLLMEYSPYPIIWHNGASSGVNNNLAFIPQDRLGLVILCNTRDTLLAEALTLQFFDMVYGKENKDWNKILLEMQQELEKKSIAENKPLENPLPALPLESYAGTYANTVYGNAKVSVEGDHLKLEIGPKPTIWTLKHYNKDAFSLWWFPEEGDTKVFFEFDKGSKPSRMTVELLQSGGQGTFEAQ